MAAGQSPPPLPGSGWGGGVFGKNCGDCSQFSLVGSMGSTHRIEHPSPSGCGETPEFEGACKKIRVESGPEEEISGYYRLLALKYLFRRTLRSLHGKRKGGSG